MQNIVESHIIGRLGRIDAAKKVRFIDEHTFGDLKSFREQFANLSRERTFEILRERLKPVYHRTLRRQVTA